jgi:drug/metabolite transporter (DMT)-like permease
LTKQESTLKPLIELTIASAFWGFGFIGTIWALKFLSFPAVIFYRFAGAFAFGALLWFWTKPNLADLRREFRLAWPAGLWLGITLLLQTWGLLTTTATKSAFITVLYVVIVPLFAFVLDKERLSMRNGICLVIALIGTAMIVQVNLSTIAIGDILTLGNAIAAAYHIRIMSQVAPKAQSHYNFNLFQCLWTAILVTPLFFLSWGFPDLFRGTWSLQGLDQSAWIGLLCLTFGSSLLAFFLQVRAQRKLSATVAALLFLMESPISAFFAVWLLGDRLSFSQVIGAALIFFACSAASLTKSRTPDLVTT